MIKREIPVYSPWISDEDVETVRKATLSGWVSSSSPDVFSFEQEFAATIGVRKAISCSSGTAALHLGLRAAGIGPGDEVIVPDLTFIAPASMVVACGATPVFADVSAEDWNLTPDSVSRCVTPRTRAVIAVHHYGNPADCESLAEAAPGVTIIEDAAQSCGASRGNMKAGAFGTLGCFSFFGNAFAAVVFGTGELRGSMLRHLRQSAPGVVLAVDCRRVGVTVDLRYLPAESKCEIAVLIATFRIQEIDHGCDINRRAPELKERIRGNCDAGVAEKRDTYEYRCLRAVSVQQLGDEHAHKRQCKQQGPEGKSLEGEHEECPAQNPSRHWRRSTQAKKKCEVKA
jgi:hypothetical protein